MASNASGDYRLFRYYEGLCSSGDFPKEIARVLALGVKTEGIKDIDGSVITQPTVLMNKNWDIVYPTPDAGYDIDDPTTSEFNRKIDNQVSKISDTVILKTTTTPREIDTDKLDDLTIDSDINKNALTMYLEIYHPTYIADPEEYPLDCERKGIIPKLITKDMYQGPYRNTAATEEYIYMSSVCKVTIKDDTTVGSVDYTTYDDCDNIVTKINSALGNSTIATPSTNNMPPVSCTITAAYLSKIKQNDAQLYELILDTLDGGEGIEPKDYTLLDNVSIEITRENDIFTLNMIGTKKLTEYVIPAGQMYTVAKTPIEGLCPEFYMDGIYIPLEITKFHTDGKTIYFDEDVTFEATTDGLLVVRYEFEQSVSSIITERTTFLNNHYVLMRLFDRINEEGTGPMENVYNANGEVTQINSHVSPWSKLSWYRDFEEIMVDSIDADIGTNNIHDGTLWVPLETVGLNADTKIRYWINTNNDRFALIVMGNPSLDYEKDRHLISACYCGKIDSFDNSINDTAGNFALFTSSSTEPCNTVLKTEQMMHEVPAFSFTMSDTNPPSDVNVASLKTFLSKGASEGYVWSSAYVNGQNTYYIQLNDKKYFNRKVWPSYVVCDSSTGAPRTSYRTAFRRNFIMNGGKSDLMEITINPEDTTLTGNLTIYVVFSYFQEKYVITSGVTRDIFGNVVGVDKVNDYGQNTSDGVTSVSMYHTRSKAYYQRHHMLFATTEEYMSKVMYGKSSYTGEYYADRIKITHSNDGPRGTLSGLLVIDSSSLYALDELVINKDFEKDPEQLEETFVYFPITAPFSPLSDSPNSRYGFAIKKEEVEPPYADEKKILKIAANELGTLCANWDPVSEDLDGMADHPPAPSDKTRNECSVYWEIVKDTAWYGTEDNKGEYIPVKLAVKNTSEYSGDEEHQIERDGNLMLDKGADKCDIAGTYSHVKVITDFLTDDDEAALSATARTDTDGTNIAGEGSYLMYGISDTEVMEMNVGAHIRAVLDDQCISKREVFYYNIEGVPYTDNIDYAAYEADAEHQIVLEDAAPDKFLMMYLVKAERDVSGLSEDKDPNDPAVRKECPLKFIIQKFACAPLKHSGNRNELLQYPCAINILTLGGKGVYMVSIDGAYVQDGKQLEYLNTSILYDSTIKIECIGEEGYKIKQVDIYSPHNANETPIYTFKASDADHPIQQDTTSGNDYIEIANVKEDMQIKAIFQSV